jgi:DNA repair exonuclease SbcCD ATPase subunit
VNYVEQTRGWGGILNVLPTYLQIKELSSKIIEYNLDLDIQENSKKRQQLLARQADLESVWNITIDKLLSLAKQSQAFVSNSISDNISKQAAINSVSDIYFLDADSKQVRLEQYVENLETDLEKVRSESKAIEIDSKKIPGLELELALLTEKLTSEESAFSILISDHDVSDEYIKSIDKRTTSVRESLRKYNDIKKLQDYGSEENFNFLEGICPTCNQPIEDSLLPHMHNQSALGVDDNIKYLEKQKIVFDSMKEAESKKLLIKKSLISQAQQKVNATRAEIRAVKESLTDVRGAPSRVQLRKEILLEERISSVEKLAALEAEIKQKLVSTMLDWSIITEALKKLPWDGFSRNDNIKLNELLNFFKENLKDFDYKSTPIEDFEISKRTYKPAIDDVDLGSEASASDNIRVIWAYMYSLLTLDSRLNGLSTNHLGLLMLDEPRQQETKEVNFKTFIEKAARTFEMDKQVIIATSEKHDDLLKMIDGLKVNVISFESPVISRI